MERLKQTCLMRHVWSMQVLLIVWFTIIFHTIKNLFSLHRIHLLTVQMVWLLTAVTMSLPSIMHMPMPPPPTLLHLVSCQVTMRWMRTMKTPTGSHPVWKMSSKCNSWISRSRRFQEKTSSEFFLHSYCITCVGSTVDNNGGLRANPAHYTHWQLWDLLQVCVKSTKFVAILRIIFSAMLAVAALVWDCELSEIFDA